MPEQDPDEATEHPTEPDAAPEEPADEVHGALADESADDETVADAEAGREPDEEPAVDAAEGPGQPDEPQAADVPEEPEESADEAAETVSGEDAEEPAEADPSEGDPQADVRDDDPEPEPTEPTEPTEPVATEPEPHEEPGDGSAADEPAEEKPPTGRQRLSDALFHFRRGQAIVAALLCVLGFAAVLQVRTNDQDNSYNGQREQDLIDILSGLAGTTQKAQEQLSALQRTRSDLESETNKQQAALDRSQQQVDTLRVMAGTTPVKGPGVNITVEPGPDELHLTPVLDLIEELRTNGAEAIDLNSKVRLVASTSVEVSQNVPGLVVEGQLVRPPYKFHVIGAPETLKGAIDFFRGPKDELEGEGAKVHLTTSENIEITSVHTPSH